MLLCATFHLVNLLVHEDMVKCIDLHSFNICYSELLLLYSVHILMHCIYIFHICCFYCKRLNTG